MLGVPRPASDDDTCSEVCRHSRTRLNLCTDRIYTHCLSSECCVSVPALAVASDDIEPWTWMRRVFEGLAGNQLVIAMSLRVTIMGARRP